MQPKTLSEMIAVFLLLCCGGVLLASEADEHRERASALRKKASEIAERGNKDDAERLEKESVELLEKAERMELKAKRRREMGDRKGSDDEVRHLKGRLHDLLAKERRMRESDARETVSADAEDDKRVVSSRQPNEQVRYISPAGSGERSGVDQDNAARLGDINEMIRLVGPGGTVYLATDAGPYPTTDRITVSRGGSADHPVKIKGIDRDGKPAKALITGTRTSPYPNSAAAFAKMKEGNELFCLSDGADHLSFSSLSFQNIGNGAFIVRAKLRGLTLEDMVATNVRRFVERSADVECSITDLTIRRVSVTGFSKSVIRLDGNTSGVLIEDVLGDSMGQDFDNFPEGIDLSGKVHDVVIRRCQMRNSRQTLGTEDFWNGDGFTTEKETSNILFEDCEANGSTDAGFDLKSNCVTLLRCKSYDNAANFKLWGQVQVVMRDCVSENPRSRGGAQEERHLTGCWGANIRVENCRFTDKQPRAVVYHTEANDEVDPQVGSKITIINSKVKSSGKLSFVDIDSKIVIDGVERPFDGR